jgi:glucose-1-phosphate cytidylyltransferase
VKVVLFCGGLGTRLQAYSDTIPKPMVPVGDRPILWHLMRYYAHFGHTEFILCLGYRGDAIKRFFAENSTAPASAWRVSCVDTGLQASVGERLWAVRTHVESEAVFLANYSDALSDLDLPAELDFAARSGTVATFASVRSHHTFHVVETDAVGRVRAVRPATESGVRINGGFFVLRHEIFDHLRAGEDLVAEPFQRLLEAEQLSAYRHDGFWHCMDTFKDKQAFDDMVTRGTRPWEVWCRAPDGAPGARC